MGQRKTWGYLIAIESEWNIPAEEVEQALREYWSEYRPSQVIQKVDAESMGEIDCYEGQETK